MAENSNIEWTDHTFNPVKGCTKVSAGCKNCYAEALAKRFGEDFAGARIKTSVNYWQKPLKWNRDAINASVDATGLGCAAEYRPRVFCASLADVFEQWDGPIVDHWGQHLVHGTNGYIPEDNEQAESCSRVTMDDIRADLFRLIDATPNLDWLLLTKRPENIRKMWWGDTRTGFRPFRRENVWLGTTVESQHYAEERIPHLAECSDLAPVTFVSCEPLLENVDLSSWLAIEGDRDGTWRQESKFGCDPEIDWVIAGGESGPNARPSHPAWFRSLRDQCQAAGVPFHFKQHGEWYPIYGTGKWRRDDQEEASRFCWITDDGWITTSGCESDTLMVWKGKKAAGRLLDGVEHNGLPVNP